MATASLEPELEAPLSRLRSPSVVAVGGGTGLPVLLAGLKAVLCGPQAPAADVAGQLTAIVTVADDGGSSGRLREAFGIPAPGDIRNCLLALADEGSPLAAIFDYRFDGGGELSGHSLGNLILTALHRIESRFPAAVERTAEILSVRGRVLPSTEHDVRLLAEFTDGTCAAGESRIAAAGRRIRRVRLQPERARALPEARHAIAEADVVVIGPGSLYTSLIPVLLVPEIASELARTSARVVLVLNLMSEPGETDGYTAVDHVLALREHVPGVPIHDVLLNVAPIPKAVRRRYAAEGARPVDGREAELAELGCRPVGRDLLADGPLVRHDSRKLAAAVLELA